MAAFGSTDGYICPATKNVQKLLFLLESKHVILPGNFSFVSSVEVRNYGDLIVKVVKQVQKKNAALRALKPKP